MTGVEYLMAGAVAGLSNCIILQPFDLVKTRLQNSKVPADQLIKTIYETESLAGFWKGTTPTILRNVPGTALYFYFLKSFQWGMRIINPVISPEISNFLAGASARIMAGTILMPVTVIKTRFEANVKTSSILGTASVILKTEGIRGFFSGLIATSFRDAPYAGIYFSFYSSLRKSMESHLPMTLSTTIAAALAGTSATVLTHPFDVIKTRMQLNPIVNKSFIKTLTSIAKKDGLGGFLSGIGPRLARKPLQSMISWIVFEELIKFKP